MLCRHELITIVTPLSRPGSAETAASVCLYSVYRKQERPLFTAALEQTSNVPTAIIRPRPRAGLWSPTPSIRLAIASLCHAARLRFDRCATAAETRPLPAVSRSHPPATSADCPAVSDGEGEAVIPRPVVRGPMAVSLPRSRSLRTLPPDGFERATAGYVDRPQTECGPVIGREWRRVRPMIVRRSTPITQVTVRTRAKSITGFSLSKPVPGFKTGYRFTGSRLTSLVVSM